MAACPSCNSIGAAIDKPGRLVHQRASNDGAEGSIHVGMPTVDCGKGMKGADEHGGHLIMRFSPFMPYNNQAGRFASIAVAATAWAGLSMCPAEALAMAYGGDLRNVGESVFGTSTSLLQLSDHVTISGDFKNMGEIDEQDGMRMLMNAEIEVSVGNVPSIKPPNEGLNSPWVPKINGLKKKDNNKRASMRCPKWTESELEMVLPDLQGRPKPYPRQQGHLYPFWPATTSTNNDSDDSDHKYLIRDKFKQSSNELSSSVIESASSTPDERARDMHNHETSSASPAPPPHKPQMPIKEPSCFTM